MRQYLTYAFQPGRAALGNNIPSSRLSLGGDEAFFDADGQRGWGVGRPDSILSMDESVVQVAQILGVFGDKTVLLQ